MATIGSVDSDLDGRMIEMINFQIKLLSLLLSFVIKTAKERSILNEENMLEFVKSSAMFKADRYPF